MSAGNTNNTVFIQRLFTSRDNFVDGNVQEATANALAFVGQEGRIWWEPTTNKFYYSDGNTPGGIPIIGSTGNGLPEGPTNSIQYNAGGGYFGGTSNVTISGNGIAVVGNVSAAYFNGDGGYLTNVYSNSNTANYLANFAGNIAGNNITISNTANLGNFTISDQTLAGTITDRTIRLSPVGNATVQVLNGIQVYQGSFSGSNPLFSVSNDGVVSTLVPNAISYLGAFEIVGNPAGSTVPPQNYGVMLHTTGTPGTPGRIYNDGVDAYGAIINRRYNGTSAAPSGVLADQIIARYGGTPYIQTTGWPQYSTVRLDFVSTEIQTATNQGTQVQLWATPKSSNVPVITAQFEPGEVLVTGNINPNSTTGLYSLGNATNKWANLWLGPDSLWIEDTVTSLNTEITVEDGTLFINGSQRIQIGNMQMTTDGISLVANASSQNISIGRAGDTGNTEILNAGVEFPDHTLQTTAAIPLNQKGNAFGVVPLNGATKIDSIYLPAGGLSFQGIWNASTNTPILADGIGNVGDQWIVGTAGTANLGSGNITFGLGDFAIYNSSNIWQDVPVGSIGVTSFNTRTGAVVLNSNDVTTALNPASITNAKLVNANITLNTGFGLSGGGIVSLGNSLTLTTQVGNILPGTGVGVSSSGGNYTISIGQAVGTANSVQFFAVSASTTIQATGNVIGGNLVTAGKVFATGNIETQGNLITPNTIINSSITSTGNVNFTGANISLGAVGNVKITGGTSGQFLTTNGSGTISWSNVSAANITGTIANANYAAYAGNVTIAGQGNITSLGTLTGLTSGGVVNFATSSNVNIGSIANLHIAGGNVGDVLTTGGSGNLTWQAPSGNTLIYSGANTTANVDFTYNSTTLIYLPTGPVTINLSNYTAGHTALVMIRFSTPYAVTLGTANAQQSTDGVTVIPTTGAGGHKIRPNQAVELRYTCFDNTSNNCYVGVTFL